LFNAHFLWRPWNAPKPPSTNWHPQLKKTYILDLPTCGSARIGDTQSMQIAGQNLHMTRIS
jgi:hypothetical protein